MKVLITGINGLLGTALAGHFSQDHEVTGITLTSHCTKYKNYNIDLADKQAVYQAVSRINPDVVIHTAAISNVDECEKMPVQAFKINALGTRNIALACQRFDSVLCYISTDYVFGGKVKKAGYKEFDETSPVNVYGQAKLLGEWYTKHLVNKFLILRVSWLFGHSRNNFVLDMARSFSSGKQYNAVSDMVSAPSYVEDLTGVIAELIDKGLYGVYHLTNSGFTSRYETAKYIAKLLGKPEKLVTQKTLKALKLAAKRPRFSGMDNHCLKLEGLGPLRSWQEAIKAFLIKERFIG